MNVNLIQQYFTHNQQFVSILSQAEDANWQSRQKICKALEYPIIPDDGVHGEIYNDCNKSLHELIDELIKKYKELERIKNADK